MLKSWLTLRRSGSREYDPLARAHGRAQQEIGETTRLGSTSRARSRNGDPSIEHRVFSDRVERFDAGACFDPARSAPCIQTFTRDLRAPHGGHVQASVNHEVAGRSHCTRGRPAGGAELRLDHDAARIDCSRVPARAGQRLVYRDIVSGENCPQRADWTIFSGTCPARITARVSGSGMGAEAPAGGRLGGWAVTVPSGRARPADRQS